ncbi:MAG: glycosyltransferase family 4 protein [Planctomycetes bacterium]|nr:glycosyltransferase family 4 protein [Planctomycetota bacterium]
MRIGYVLRSLEDSGVTIYCLTLADAMRQRGHDVFLVSDHGVYADEVKRRGLRHHHLPLCRGPLRTYLGARRLADVVRRERPDVLHGNWRRAQLACHLAEKKLGTPYVTTLHLVGIPESWLYRKLSYWGRLTIAPCSEAVEYLRGRFHVPQDRIRLVFHGVDSGKWPVTMPERRAEARRAFGLSPDAPVAVCVARLDWIKDHATLLRGVARARESHGDLRVLLVGEGPERPAIEKAIAELNLGEHVRMLGFCDPHDALAAADMFLLTSLQESFGFSPVEAMLTGLPVVRTATEGAADQIQPGRTGEIIPIGDPEAVARVLADLATSRDAWRERGRAAHELASRQFTLAAMAEKTERVYHEALEAAER